MATIWTSISKNSASWDNASKNSASWDNASKNSASFYGVPRRGSNMKWEDAAIPWENMTVSWESLAAITYSGVTKNTTAFSGVSKS